MHDPHGQCAKLVLFTTPVLFSDCSLLSLGDIFRHLLLLRKDSNVKKSQ